MASYHGEGPPAVTPLWERFASEIDWTELGSTISELYYDELTLTAGDHECPEVDLILVSIATFLKMSPRRQVRLIDRWERTV